MMFFEIAVLKKFLDFAGKHVLGSLFNKADTFCNKLFTFCKKTTVVLCTNI